jgi:hypothetical protein
MHDLVTIADMVEQAKQRGRPVTETYLRRLCRQKRIPGAFKFGNTWAVPAPYAERWLQEYVGRIPKKRT